MRKGPAWNWHAGLCGERRAGGQLDERATEEDHISATPTGCRPVGKSGARIELDVAGILTRDDVDTGYACGLGLMRESIDQSSADAV